MHVSSQNNVPGKKPRHANMSSLEKYSCKAWRRKGTKRKTPVSLEPTSDPPSKPDAVHSAGAEKKTRGKAVQHPDTKPSPVSHLSPVLHTPTPETAATNGHLSQNTATHSLKNAQKGRKKKTEKTETSDRCPGSDLSQTEPQKAISTPSRTQGWKRAAKETSPFATLSCPSFQQGMPISSPKCDSGVKGRERWRANPRLSSTPQRSKTLLTEPQISPVTVAACLSSVTLSFIIYSGAKKYLVSHHRLVACNFHHR